MKPYEAYQAAHRVIAEVIGGLDMSSDEVLGILNRECDAYIDPDDNPDDFDQVVDAVHELASNHRDEAQGLDAEQALVEGVHNKLQTPPDWKLED